MFINEYDKTHAPKLIFWSYTMDRASSELCCDPQPFCVAEQQWIRKRCTYME